MIRGAIGRRIAGLTACGLGVAIALGAIPVPAQQADTPFFAYYGGALRHAFAIEMMAARAALLAQGGLEGDDALEVVEEAAQRYLPMLAGSLAARSPQTLETLEDALERSAAALERGDEAEAAEAARQALVALDHAAGMLVPTAAAADRGFSAQVMTMLLLVEDGVAEGFEEFMEGEPAEYLEGRAVLQRVETWWVRLRDGATGPETAAVEEALTELRALFASPTPPVGLAEDPEAAEEPAHRLVGGLEAMTGVSLYPDRDLGRVVALLGEQVRAAREAEGADGRMRQERLAAASFLYEQYLGDLVQVLEPELHARVEEGLERLAQGVGSNHDYKALLTAVDEIRAMF